MKHAILAIGVVLFATMAIAQSNHGHQPYSGLERRAIKALSEREIADLRAGRGMGLALAAELNGYPGPLHVLEHAEALGLSPTQQTRTQAAFDAMRSEAMPLGERLIEQETALDRLFATRAADTETLRQATSAIAQTQGVLRATHLRYHLVMMEVLTPEQVRRYAKLRGYAGEHQHKHGHGGDAH